jgi:DNA-binding GntR family transcriptional regulator
MSSDPVYASLREAIVAGELQPNERLIEADLSKHFGFTRAAVRTALLLLEQDGLVLREPNRGARVRLIGAEEAIEILEAREALEGVAARHAALNATEQDVHDLREILARMRNMLDGGDLLGASDESDTLHARLAEISRHQTVTRLISMLKSQTVRFQFRTILVPGRPEQAFAEHSAIVEAIEARDSEAAERAMRQHLSHIRETLRHDRDGRGGRR